MFDILSAMCPFIWTFIHTMTQYTGLERLLHTFFCPAVVNKSCEANVFKLASHDTLPVLQHKSTPKGSPIHMSLYILTRLKPFSLSAASMCYMQDRSNYRICPICFHSQLLDLHKG